MFIKGGQESTEGTQKVPENLHFSISPVLAAPMERWGLYHGCIGAAAAASHMTLLNTVSNLEENKGPATKVFSLCIRLP